MVNSQVGVVGSGRRNWRRFGKGRALGSLVLLNGLVVSSWAPEIPVVQQHLGLCAVHLGLLALWASSSVVFPAVTLLLFGSSFAIVDVSTNAASVRLGARCQRPLLSGLHGLFGIGALLGTPIGSTFLTHGAPLGLQYAGVVRAALPTLAALPDTLRSAPEAKAELQTQRALNGPRLRPTRVLAPGSPTSRASVAEGSVADWSGVDLKTVGQSAPDLWCLGFAAFSLPMIVGRLFGDHLTLRPGCTRLGRLGTLLTDVSLLLDLRLPAPRIVVVGFGGLGPGL